MHIIIPLKVKYLLFKNYTYLVINTETKQAFSIDPAWEQNTIEACLEKYSASLCSILVTHHHKDHIHLAKPLAKKHNIPIKMSAIEVDTYGVKSPYLDLIHTDEALTVAGIQVIPHLTPGHTAGSICYEAAGGLFTGDTLFAEGCGNCLAKSASPWDLYNSLQALKRDITPDTKIYPGHSYGTPVGTSLKDIEPNNIYFHFDKAEDFVKFRMRKGQKSFFNFD